MKCPTCGEELITSKKNPNYLLCFTCKKKYKIKPKEEIHYSNIPKEHVRKHSEKKVKSNYQKMLDAEESTKATGKRKNRKNSKEVDRYDDGGSIIPLVILGVLIVIVAALIVYMYFFR
ncbi:MAG: hypothetical protein ACK5LL_12345 [Suipraeoptans sp.]